jgi:hypothetical protein
MVDNKNLERRNRRPIEAKEEQQSGTAHYRHTYGRLKGANRHLAACDFLDGEVYSSRGSPAKNGVPTTGGCSTISRRGVGLARPADSGVVYRRANRAHGSEEKFKRCQVVPYFLSWSHPASSEQLIKRGTAWVGRRLEQAALIPNLFEENA